MGFTMPSTIRVDATPVPNPRESGFEVKTNPSPAEVAWFRNRPIPEYQT